MGTMGKFADQDSYVLTAQVLTADNNQLALNVALLENDHLRATSTPFVDQAVTRTIANPVPLVTAATTLIVGAALAGVGQEGTASEGGGGGGAGCCFSPDTLILMADGSERPLVDVVVGIDYVKSFNSLGEFVNARVLGKWEGIYANYYRVTFADGRVTQTTDDHRYWASKDRFLPISKLDSVFYWNGAWSEIAIIKKEAIEGEILLYNLHVDQCNTYIANGDACHNLKPIE